MRLDYSASVPNLLYVMMTGQRLSPKDDPYRLDGSDREVAKWAMKFLLNTKGLWGAELALNNWMSTEGENPKAREMVAQAVQKVGSSRRLLELVILLNVRCSYGTTLSVVRSEPSVPCGSPVNASRCSRPNCPRRVHLA